MDDIWLKKASRVEIGERTVGGGYLHLWRFVRGIEKMSPNTFRGMIMFHGAGLYVYGEAPINQDTVWQLYNPEIAF